MLATVIDSTRPAHSVVGAHALSLRNYQGLSALSCRNLPLLPKYKIQSFPTLALAQNNNILS